MAKKHLAAVSLLIVLIFGLTACVCRSSDTAISVPVYDKPASATANNRTMQDETATKSSSEKSSEATTESAQSEDASALIFPNPCSEQFDLSERDAVLFDAAVAARNRTPNADICIPEIGVYGTYEEAEKTVIVCHVCYHFYYGCDGTEHYTDSGAMQAPAKAVLEVSDDIVNGVIHNDIFEKLNIKTTSIEVNISEDGQLITSKLTDRGEYIFSFVEKNRNYYGLRDISIVVFYLNQSAKVSFTRQMGGVTPKNYGSVFIYKNGFRINPYGEPGQDFFGIDQRKAQGWKRFLGTREIMGRISIKGDNDQFLETTSRAHGFIQTPAVDMLADLFLEKVLKVLEKYVVNLINWGEPLKSDPQHTISPNEIGEQIISQFITSVDSKDIVSVDYNPDILTKSNTQGSQDSISMSLKKLESAAERTQDTGLINLTQTLKKRTESLISHNIQLEEENAENSKELAKAKTEGLARERQIYFLKGAANQNVTNLVNGFHSIYTLTDASRGNISYLRELIAPMEIENKDFILSIVGQIQQANEKAHKLADLAIHGNQSLKQSGSHSLNDFIRQYIDAGFAIEGLKYELVQDNRAFDCKFDSSSIGIIIDNIASNSVKAGATILRISLEERGKYVEITFSDNGIGLSENINPQSLFEWGFSSNRKKKGYGIGLYHIKQLVEEMNGTVEIDTTYHHGFKLIVRLKK